MGKIIASSTAPILVLRPFQFTVLVRCVPELFSEVKQPEREADYSPSSSDEAKNCGAIPPLSIGLHAVVFDELNTGTTLPYLCHRMLRLGERSLTTMMMMNRARWIKW
jgi:hypothetical protein